MADHKIQSESPKSKSPHHVTPLSVYFNVWVTLLIFTVITVAVSYVDFGEMNMIIAMIVATIKAVLVMAFFMGLKYDTAENSVTFLLSFVFLGIFITLTSIDIFYRIPADPLGVEASAPSSSAPVDAKKMITGSPDLLEKGKQVFAQNCVTCHGAAGKGDGAAAAALNPKPRNFSEDAGWKNGRKISQIYGTLTKGIPSSPMPAFAGLPVEDRFALAHYVQSLGPKAPGDTDADVAALGLNVASQAKPELSLEDATEKYTAGVNSGSEAVAYQYRPGVVPRTQYCALKAPWRPRWCDVSGSSTAAAGD